MCVAKLIAHVFLMEKVYGLVVARGASVSPAAEVDVGGKEKVASYSADHINLRHASGQWK